MNCVEHGPEHIAFELERAHGFPLKLGRVAIFQGNRERLVRIASRLRDPATKIVQSARINPPNRTFRRPQAGRSSDPAQKARSATTRWRSAMADCARNSRTHPPRIELRATDGDYPVARHAISRTLHQVAATLRCRLRLERRCLRARPKFLPACGRSPPSSLCSDTPSWSRMR